MRKETFMTKKPRKIAYKIIAGLLAMALLLLTACGAKPQASKNSRVKLVVSVHDANLLKDYAPYLQQAVPEAELEFIVGRDFTDFYLFKQENGDLPDIILLGSIFMRDAAELNEYLLDLSDTDTAATFYGTYLERYRDADGSVKWLPASSIANGIMANTDLFEKYNIPLPTDYPSFAAACAAFEEVGVTPYISDFKYDYTCLYTLEGVSLPLLMTKDGLNWRSNYVQNQTDSLDEELWKKAFSHYKTFIDDTGMNEETTGWGYSMTYNAYTKGEVAMVRGMSTEIAGYSEFHSNILLPYFGDTEDDNWILTTPTFYSALSKELGEDKNSAKREAAFKVLDAMYSQGGHDALTKSFGYTLPYNRGIDAPIPDELKNLEKLVEDNHMYILMTSESLNAAAKEAIQGMMRGELTSDAAYALMNDMLVNTEKTEPEIVATLQKAYPVDFDKEKGNRAGSAISNSMRKISGCDLLLAPSSVATGSIYATGYSYQMADAMFQSSGNRIYTIEELSGAQIHEIIRQAVEGYDSVNSPFSDQTLPIVSGFTITVEKTDDGYRLADISISDDETYSFAVVDNPLHCRTLIDSIVGENALNEQFVQSDEQAHKIWADYLAEGNQPEAPSDYITLK